ncbi:glutaredoxin 3 [Granulosicoccus antarcticus]|uniref:Glutaredoxin n=1 Tax=Granulosicoccus antarcticus IMCC3135 TaxID=1192854 RepID=A0A2Z2NYB4_9GAMM|nr:glutaredoxin 3 [Granulosicoccus antarcticus]ASJ76299.1 Glutaredoxin-3 [Granulosicoccus antarcticus IMCC3135]
MINVEIYTKGYCPYCHRAKALLDEKGVSYTEYEVSTDQARQQEMRERSGRRTVPQVFINNRHIGGSDDLMAANHSGLLDELLSSHAAKTA